VARAKRRQEIAVIGLGHFGRSVALRLEALGLSVLGIDIDARMAKDVASDISETLILDANDLEALEQADIPAFHTVIVAIGSDFEANALVTSSLKAMGVPYVISQAKSNRHREILTRIGADRVIIPDEETGIRLADELSTPGLLYSLPLSADYNLIEIKATEELIGERVELGDRYNVIILLILRGTDLIVTPEKDFLIQSGDILIVLGEKRALTEFTSKT